MLFLHIDQRPARRYCLEQLALLPSSDPWFEHGVFRDIEETIGDCELVPNATVGATMDTLEARWSAGQHDECRRLVSEVIRKRGRVRLWGVGVVVALLAAATVGIAALWSMNAAVTVGCASLLVVLFSLPVGGLVTRTAVLAVVHGPTRRMVWRWQMFQALSPGSAYAQTLYQRMIADVESRRVDGELAGFFFGAAMDTLASRAADKREAELLRRVYGDTLQLIHEDRVPWLAGHGLCGVVKTAASAGTAPGVSRQAARDVLRTLARIAPDAAIRCRYGRR